MHSLSGTIIGYDGGFAKIQTRDLRIFHVPRELAGQGVGALVTVQIHRKGEEQTQDLEAKRILLAELIN
ncbi:hypothetical protein HOG48_02755 [Candidatus Peregrinibacteria bacterium]|jgi:hypothetical protein|nr:hypothetical protein [Candidatus Peregrinibacteria bacterium]